MRMKKNNEKKKEQGGRRRSKEERKNIGQKKNKLGKIRVDDNNKEETNLCHA